MKGTLIALDLVKDVDNSFKVLEMNTSVKLMFDSFDSYGDLSSLHQYITDNSINDIHIIGQSQAGDPGNVKDEQYVDPSGGTKNTNLGNYLVDHYSGSSVDVTIHSVEYTSVNIPYVEDGENKLILRNSFDSSAVIDSEYAAQNINFLNLLNDSGSSHLVPKMFMSGGIDTIGTGSVRDNGNVPNYLIKKGTPTQSYFFTPALFNISGSEQLENLKNGYLANDGDDYVQEYIYNPNDLVDGKIKTYRIWGFVDPELNLIPFNTEPFYHTNSTAITEHVDYLVDDNGIKTLQPWERPKFLQKIKQTGKVLGSNVLGEQKIVLNDNSIVNADTLDVGTSVLKAISIPNLSTDNSQAIAAYSGSLSDFSSNTTFVSASLTNKTDDAISLTKAVHITTSEGKILTVATGAPILVEKNNETAFILATDLDTSMSIVEVNYSTNTSRAVSISELRYSFSVSYASELDVEEADVFAVAYDDLTPNLGFIIHNPAVCYCQYCQYGAYDSGLCLTGLSCSSYYKACTSSGYYCFGYSSESFSGCGNGGKT